MRALAVAILVIVVVCVVYAMIVLSGVSSHTDDVSETDIVTDEKIHWYDWFWGPTKAKKNEGQKRRNRRRTEI